MSIDAVRSQRSNPMTVCIAALCECGQKVIAVADRMIVSGQMGHPITVQRERRATKIVDCSKTVSYMNSGTSQGSEWIKKELTRIIQTSPNKETLVDV